MGNSFSGQPQRSADAVAIGLGSDQQNLQPVIGVAAVVAKQRGIIAAIVGDDVDVAVVIVISGGQAATRDGPDDIGTERFRNFLEQAFAQIPKHEQRLLVRNFSVIEVHVVEHRTVQLQNVRPAVVVVIQKFHGYAAQQNRLVADAGMKSVVVEGAVVIVVVQAVQLEIKVRDVDV